MSEVTQLVPSRTRNCTQAIWSRVHTLNYHARLERGGEWEESGGMMIREWKKEQEAWDHKFLLSTFYISSTEAITEKNEVQPYPCQNGSLKKKKKPTE